MGKKKILTGLAVSVLCTAGTLSGVPNHTDLVRDLSASAVSVNTSDYGDINGDGKVGATDTGYIQQYINGTRTLSTRERIYADLNADEKIDEDDIQIISYIYTALNTDYVSSCKSTWYDKYSSRTYGSLTFDYLDDGTVEITDCDENIVSVTIPEKINGFPVSKIIGHSFSGINENLKSVSLPNSLTEIGDFAFLCSKLTSVVIPDNVTTIGNWAFSDSELTSVKLGKNVTELGFRAFASTKITSIELPDSLKKIGAQALFTDKLDSITIPKSVEIIESNQGFETIYAGTITVENPNCTIEEGALNVDVIRGYLGSTAETYANKHNIEFVSLTTKTYAGIEYTLYKNHAEVTACSSNAGTVSIMSSVEGVPVTKIAENGLVNGKFKSIILPSSVTEIGDHAFWECANVTDITFSKNLKTIGVAAFLNCDSLKTVNLPEGLKEIKQHAFWSCESLESVTIPESVEILGQSAFLTCKSLSEVKILNRKCVVEDNSATIPNWAIIYGYRESTAKDYADKYGNTFIPLDPVVVGDINEDGRITVADALILKKWLLGVPNTKIANWEIADLYEDGRIDAFDMVKMRELLIENK